MAGTASGRGGPLTLSAHSAQRPLRVGVVTPRQFWYNDHVRSSINIEHFAHALRELGHDALRVCPDGSLCSSDVKWMTAPLPSYQDPNFWRGLHLDAAIFFTWLGYPVEVRAMRGAGLPVVSRADSTGATSPRLFPGSVWSYVVRSQTGLRDQARGFKDWLEAYGRGYKRLDAEVINSARAANAIAIETQTGANRLERLFTFYREPELRGKVVVAPHLIGADIFDTAVPAEVSARRVVVAVGRWDSWQKDAPLLAATLSRYLQAEPDAKAVVMGVAGPEAVAALVPPALRARLTCTGPIPREQVKEHLARAHTLVLTSQWESFHIAAHEALCMGCTVVGPDTIPLEDICAAGDFGTRVMRRSPAALARALQDERKRWHAGQRDPEAIARFWRERLRPAQIVHHMLDAALNHN